MADRTRCRRLSRAFSALLPLALLAAAGCGAAGEVRTAASVEETCRRVFVPDLAIETFFGFDFGRMSVREAVLGKERYLAVIVAIAEGERPHVVYLPARFTEVAGGTSATIQGNGGAELTAFLPGAQSGAALEAVFYLWNVSVQAAYPDGRRDQLRVAIDREDETLQLEIGWSRLGPPGFGPFGRDTIEEQAPIALTLRRSPSVLPATVWLPVRP
ncbi:MAG: hypothetical protein HY812_22345 [Planctomycetes bacterium]|nr:hypothetical protein [Planctomycetota bacterium]